MSDVEVSKEELERWLKEKGFYDSELDYVPREMREKT